MGIDFPNSPSAGDTYTYEGETYRYNGVAFVKVRDRVTTFNGVTGAIVGVTSVQGKTGDVTLTDLEITHGVETFNGLSGSIDTTLLTLPVTGISGAAGITFSDGTFQPTASRSGFRYTMVSSGSGLGTPSSGHMDIDKSSEVDTLSINHTDKEGNNLKPLFEKLRDNGGYLEIMTGDFSQAAAIAIESQSGDDSIVNSGETTITVGASTSTVQAEFDIEQGLDQVSITDIYLRIVPNAANFIRSFNGITGSVDTSTLSLSVAGITASSGISCEGGILLAGDLVFSNGEVIRNSPDGSIQIVPSDEGGNHFGIEIDATEWGFGPVINVIDESGTQVTKAIRLDTDITFSDTNVPDGSPARLMFGNASDRGFQQNNNNDGTVMFGVNGDNGHFAVGRKADLGDGDRSMSTDDKSALSMTNPQFLVYSADSTDANDYLRIEHDQTDANIYSGNGGINLVPLSGAVGISGGGLNIKANGITFADGTFLSSEAQIAFKNESNTFTDNQFITAGKGIGANGLDLGIRFDANQVVVIGDPEDSSNSVKLTVDDNDGVVKVENADFDIPTSIRHLGDTNTKIQFGTDTVDFDAGGREGMKLTATETQFNDGIRITSAGITFADSTHQKGAAKDVGTFTISASSAISTGAKADALHRIPYNATLTKFELKSKAAGGMTAAVYIAGADFGNPTNAFITGATAETTGVTGETTTFGTASVSEGDFVYLHVLANASGATAAQAFVSYETR